MKNWFLLAIVFSVSFTTFGQNVRQDAIDDGFSWFEAFATSENTGINGAPVATGWALKSWIRLIGDYPNRSGLKLVVSKGGKSVATTRCETDIYHRTGNDVDESYMRTTGCWQGKSVTEETGGLDVQVFAINGETNAEKLVRTYKLDVRPVNRVPSGQQPGVEPPKYIIMRHEEAPVSFMFLRPSGYVSYFDVDQRPERSGANHVEIYYSLSPNDVGRNLPHSSLRCTVNGKLLSMPGPMPYADQTTSTIERWYQETYQDRLAPKYKAGIEYREDIRFQMVRIRIPLTWGKVRDSNRVALEDQKGSWECSMINNGETWRMWRWKIGADGMPEIHSEQKGNVNLAYNTFLVEMEIPAGGSALDGRLTGASSSLFYGQQWTSVEGKTMAGKVPKKGSAFPIPSTAAK